VFVFFPDIWWFQVEFSLNQSNKYSGIVWEWPPRMGLEWLKYVMLRSGDIRINHGGMYQKSGCSIIIIRTRMRPAKIEGTRILAYPLVIEHGLLENPRYIYISMSYIYIYIYVLILPARNLHFVRECSSAMLTPDAIWDDFHLTFASALKPSCAA